MIIFDICVWHAIFVNANQVWNYRSYYIFTIKKYSEAIIIILSLMTESKEAMQNTIKNLQAKSDFIYKLEDKGSKTIVLQIGSHTIKMGFAN